jgi:hypothetical protein
VTELLNELRRSLAGEVIGPEDGEFALNTSSALTHSKPSSGLRLRGVSSPRRAIAAQRDA